MKIIIFLLLALIVIAILAKLVPQKKNSEYDLSKYYRKESIVTQVEKWMYNIINETISEEYMIAPKVGMKDYIGVKSGKDYIKHFGHIAQKHIDFLICKKEDLSPVLGIEIDDLSHQKNNRKKRDQDNDQIYNAIGLKIIHIPTNTKENELKEIINNSLI